MVKIRHPESGLVGTRIPDVGNPWLDAGIVPYSTLRYNTDRDYWNNWFPADWVSESFPGQFRNWFYSLLAQSAAFTNRKPFENLFSYGLVMAEDGREMHKSWGNAIWFDDAAETMGSDTMRWLYASANPEKNVRFGYGIGDEVRRRVIIPLWNVYSFLVTYARADGWEPVKLSDVEPSPVGANAQLDKWIVERLSETALAARKALDNYDAQSATVALEEMLDDLSNWYVRRSRRRFWRTEADVDKQAAYATLHHVLVEFVKLMAPFIPFTTEAIYQNLVRSVDGSAPSSVHHHIYPGSDAAALDKPLLAKMRTAITVAKLGRSARSSVDMKLRQPLAEASVFVGSAQARADLEELADVLGEEINVKQLRIVSEVGELVNYRLLPNSRALGPKYGKDFPKVRQALTDLDAADAATTLQNSGELVVVVDGNEVTLSADDVLVQTESRGGLAVASEKGVTVAIDTNLSDELVQEGYARDLVRFLNNLRKESGFDISDRIEVVYEAEGVAADTLRNFANYIRQETLAVSLVNDGTNGASLRETTRLGDNEVAIAIRKVTG